MSARAVKPQEVKQLRELDPQEAAAFRSLARLKHLLLCDYAEVDDGKEEFSVPTHLLNRDDLRRVLVMLELRLDESRDDRAHFERKLGIQV